MAYTTGVHKYEVFAIDIVRVNEPKHLLYNAIVGTTKTSCSPANKKPVLLKKSQRIQPLQSYFLTVGPENTMAGKIILPAIVKRCIQFDYFVSFQVYSYSVSVTTGPQYK